MRRQHASVAALGACAIGTAMLLAQPARSLPSRTSSAVHTARTASSKALPPTPALQQTYLTLLEVRREHAPLSTVRREHARAATLALCVTCPASHAVVRVLRVRQRHGYSLVPLTVFVDRRWPTLDSLIRETEHSVLTEIPNLTARIGITPVAIASDTLVVGVPAVAAVLTPPRLDLTIRP
ncbi:hypothetical protein [Gemmatimonas sp.]